ncbi:hypothetical protein BCR42DRAFT_428853 [Absidia repens]|uniref:N-acetyltransferase domain-containing protein n=1 Tax=Absidia repens TaxID=90262 RepID=A0A1X2HXV7_9FUNG|nr:hypothetical protein BCR42DRAFT_428853 [Absidia repens]
MTLPTIHLLSTDQYPSLIEQLARYHQPSSSQMLGWFLQTGHSSIDTLGRAKVYSTHPDPTFLPTDEPVVIMINSFHRLQVYVSTEPLLDNCGSISDTMKKHAVDRDWASEKVPRYCDGNDSIQSLYKRSVEVLESALLQLTNEWPDNEILLHGISIMWQPLLNVLYDVVSYNPCHLFCKPAEIVETGLGSPYTISKIDPDDLKIVVEKNKILYDSEYVKDCFRISTAMRYNGELVAWGYTHRDITIGGLHVLPEYRRRNLASVVVRDLCNKQAQFLLDVGPHADTVKYYVQGFVELSNVGSASLFERLGFEKSGLGTAWTVIVPRKQA